ncbi:MAG: PD40 domain-containing protein [Actinobacteria bacterium]|nr:PD40 domain-containing protein [Actinomycetota bacterium]
MKTIIIILSALFIIAVIFFGIILIRQAIPRNEEASGSVFETTEEAETTMPAITEQTAEETTAETEDVTDENINKIELYLDGDRNTGIYMGQAEYGLESSDAAIIYGPDFDGFGYSLSFDSTGYEFEPQTVHSLYIYTYIPAYGWDYTRKQLTVPGSADFEETIQISLEGPNPAKVIEEGQLGEVYVKGWTADLAYSDNTGIERVDIYLEGPRNFGRFLGQAEYGIERTDVGNAYGNANYNNSGFMLKFDASDLEPGINYLVYVYVYSKSGGFKYSMTTFTIQGDAEPKNTVVEAEAEFKRRTLEINGWAINKKFIEEGVPRSLDIEYSTKKIVFVSNQAGNRDIFSMNLDGSGLEQLTTKAGDDMYPSISPDGKKIAWSAVMGNTWQIFTMNWDGSDKKQITNIPSRCGYPSWSFDGRHIFFELYIDESWEIYVMESDGANVKRLTSNPGVDNWHPSAHPFKNITLYESGHSGSEEIWQIDIDGGNNAQISPGGRNFRVPRYSIDGKKIAFMSADSNGKEQIFIMESDGSNILQLTDTPDQARLPSFSPDNRYMAFNTKDGGSEIFIMNIDGSDKKQLTNFPGEDEVAVFMYQASE